MRAIRFDRYGSTRVLELRDLPIPETGEDGVLVRVRAAALNPYDWHAMAGLPYLLRVQSGLRDPKVKGLGSDLAGQVEAVGANVSRFRPGDEVYGRVDGLGGSSLLDLGSLAEYVVVSESSIRLRPAVLTAPQAAAVPMAGITALCAIRDAGAVQRGQHVLINGASGGVGTFAVQIAKAHGAEVTGVCSTPNMELVRSIGADHVVDYTREDVTKGGARYDLILDNVGNHSSTAYRRIMREGGTYLASFDHPGKHWFGPMGHILRMSLGSLPSSQRMVMLQPKGGAANLDALSKLIEDGRVMPVVDRTFALAEAREAMDYLATRRARGKVVIDV